MIEFSLFIGAFTSLFSIVNPLNATPIFLSLTATDTPERRIQTARKAAFYMILVMVSFFFAGTWILDFFGISILTPLHLLPTSIKLFWKASAKIFH